MSKFDSPPRIQDKNPSAGVARRVLYADAGVKNQSQTHLPFAARICVCEAWGEVLVDKEIGNRTNNEAEILAVLAAVELLGGEPGLIRSDSKLAVNMLTRRWKGKAPHLRLLVIENPLPPSVRLEWVRRDDNLAGWHLEAMYGV